MQNYLIQYTPHYSTAEIHMLTPNVPFGVVLHKYSACITSVASVIPHLYAHV